MRVPETTKLRARWLLIFIITRPRSNEATTHEIDSWMTDTLNQP